MVIKVASLEELEKVFNQAGSKAVIIDFFAEWCGPCKQIAPKITAWAVEYPSIVFVKVDVDEAEDVAQKYDISAMPTFKVIRNGKPETELIGADANKLEELIKKYK